MIFTTRGRYAVMAMVDLAIYARVVPASLAVVAARQEIDHGYLEQIFLKLKQARLVKSVKGPGGGYKLNKSPGDITLADVMLCVNEDIKMTRCNDDGHHGCMKDKSLCKTHNLWRNLQRHMLSFLQNATLDDVVNGVFQ